MYFQKLESLKREDEFKNEDMVIESFDQWLALIPRIYKDKLYPQLFSVNQEIPIDISTKIFDKAVNTGLLNERYVVKCKCNQVLEIVESLEKALEFVIEYNNDECECSFCDKSIHISTDNIFIIYRLMERANMSTFTKKKQVGIIAADDDINNLTLSDKILNNPKKYIEQVPRYKLEQTLSPQVRNKVQYLLEF